MDEKGGSSVNKKEKNSFLDDEIGNDFLTSWKSMSVTKDDAMDFGFDTFSSGKNKAFNFDKLDVDFGLDGGFDKLSSFKVDMPDFDLSSPSKKVEKAKEKSEYKSSTEKPDGKKSKFDFFDFNEMDNFDFESSMVKVGKSLAKNKDDKMDICSDVTDQQSSKIQLSDAIGVFADTIDTKLPVSKGVVTADVEALLSGSGHHIAKEKDREKTILSEDPISPNSGSSSPVNVSNNSVEATEQTTLSKKAISMDTYSQHASFDFAGPSLASVDPNTLLDRQTQSTGLRTEVHSTPSQKENENSKIAGISSSDKILPLKNSSPPNSITGSTNIRKNMLGTDKSIETVDGNGSAPGHLGLTENPIKDGSHEIKDDEGNQNFTIELPSVFLCSESVVVDKVTLLNDNESGSLNSEGEASENPPWQAALLETKSYSSDSVSTISNDKSSTTETENTVINNEPQAGIKSGDNLESAARELVEGENILIAGGNNEKYLNNLRPSQFLGEEVTKNKPIISSSDKNFIHQTPTVDHISSDLLPKESKAVVTSQLFGEEEMKKKPTSSTRDKSATNQIPTGLLEKQKAKPNSPTSVYPKRLFFSMESMRNSKIKPVEGNKVSVVGSPKKISVEGNKVSTVGSPKKMTEPSILKTSMAKEADKVSDSPSLRGTSSLQKSKPDTKKLYTASSETAHSFKITENKSPTNLSLKRKAFELPSSDLLRLKSLKHLSSPKENSDFQDVPRQAIEHKLPREDKNLMPLNCLSKTLSARDAKEPMKRVDVKESLRGAEVEKVCIREIQKENNGLDNPIIVPMMTAVESPQEVNRIEEVNVMELELSLTMKDDGSVEKAEAYAKELDDICNMLRKKHEEAKELLVCALVNNNNLLMLNHPIYEQKIQNICKVQKFAAEVMSKELKT